MDTIANAILKVLGMSVARYFLLAGIPFILFYLLIPGKFQKLKIQGRSASKKDFMREISHSMGSLAVFSLYAVVILFTPFRQ